MSFVFYANLFSIPARLQEIVCKVFPYVYPAFINNLGDFKDFLGFSLLRRAAAFIDIMQVSGLKILHGIQMGISGAAPGTLSNFRNEFPAERAFMDHDFHDVIVGIQGGKFKFFLFQFVKLGLIMK